MRIDWPGIWQHCSPGAFLARRLRDDDQQIRTARGGNDLLKPFVVGYWKK